MSETSPSTPNGWRGSKMHLLYKNFPTSNGPLEKLSFCDRNSWNGTVYIYIYFILIPTSIWNFRWWDFLRKFYSYAGKCVFQFCPSGFLRKKVTSRRIHIYAIFLFNISHIKAFPNFIFKVFIFSSWDIFLLLYYCFLCLTMFVCLHLKF